MSHADLLGSFVCFYVAEHYDEVMEEDRRIREISATRHNPPQVEELLRRLRKMAGD